MQRLVRARLFSVYNFGMPALVTMVLCIAAHEVTEYLVLKWQISLWLLMMVCFSYWSFISNEYSSNIAMVHAPSRINFCYWHCKTHYGRYY